MTDNKRYRRQNNQKLTLGEQNTLGKTAYPRNLARTIGSSGSTVVVEVKQR